MVQVTRMRLVPAAVCGGLLAATAVGAGAAGAEPPTDPPGNNGTIKVDGVVFDDHPDNQPHVGCVFEVDFYGFDEGDLDATVTFDAIAPTGDSELLTDVVPIGEDEAGGGTDLDQSQSYDLSSSLAAFTPHPEQGFHVKLTVHADGSQGADTKFKAFWVEGCETTPPTTEPPGSTTTTVPGSSTTAVPGSTPTTTPDDDEPGGPGGPGDAPPPPVPTPPAATPSVREPDYAG